MQHQPATWVSSVAKGKIGNNLLRFMGLVVCVSYRLWAVHAI